MCWNLYQDIYIILVRPRRGSGGDVSWERERTPRIILRSGMEDCLSRQIITMNYFFTILVQLRPMWLVLVVYHLPLPMISTSTHIFHPVVVLITGENISGLVWYMLLLLRIFVKNIKPWSRSPSSRPVIWARKVPPWSRAVSADSRRNTVGPPTPP